MGMCRLKAPPTFQAHVELARVEIMVEELVRDDIYAGHISQLSWEKVKGQIQTCHESIAKLREEGIK